jgi:hypothetical protein
MHFPFEVGECLAKKQGTCAFKILDEPTNPNRGSQIIVRLNTIEYHFHLDKPLHSLLNGFQNSRYQTAINGQYQHIPLIPVVDDAVISAGICDIAMGYDFASNGTNVRQTV